MERTVFKRMIVDMRLAYIKNDDAKLEPLLRDLKNHFNEWQITLIEDYIFRLDDDLSFIDIGNFYANHILPLENKHE